MIADNPYCKFCKRRYCIGRKKNFANDRDLAAEQEARLYLSDQWSLDLKPTNEVYCPHDFYCTEIPMIGDATIVYRQGNKSKRERLMAPTIDKWATPGFVIKNFKLSTLLDSQANGNLGFYTWVLDGHIKVLTSVDLMKLPDTMYDELTSEDLKQKPENPRIPRSCGKFFNPIRLKDAADYLPHIKELTDNLKHNAEVDSTRDLEEAEDY